VRQTVSLRNMIFILIMILLLEKLCLGWWAVISKTPKQAAADMYIP